MYVKLQNIINLVAGLIWDSLLSSQLIVNWSKNTRVSPEVAKWIPWSKTTPFRFSFESHWTHLASCSFESKSWLSVREPPTVTTRSKTEFSIGAHLHLWLVRHFLGAPKHFFFFVESDFCLLVDFSFFFLVECMVGCKLQVFLVGCLTFCEALVSDSLEPSHTQKMSNE